MTRPDILWDYLSITMKENLSLVGLFFVFVPMLIFSQIFLLTQLGGEDEMVYVPVLSEAVADNSRSAGSIFSPNSTVEKEYNSSVVTADARPILIKNYLEKYNSELAPYSQLIFDVSQEYGLDYRLITAIAQQESNLCKKAPENCYNCWGVGIHSRGTMCFDSYPEAIKWFGRYLREEYYDLGINTVEDIMGKYCPLSNGSWASGVRQFMAEIERNE